MRFALLGLALGAFAACASDLPRETVNVTFTISTDASALRAFAFDLEASQGLGVDWVDDARLRDAFVDASTRALEQRGFERVAAPAAELLVAYEFWIDPGATAGSTGATTRGSVVVRNARDGRFLWRATRKAPLGANRTANRLDADMRDFVDDMLRHVTEVARTAAPRR